MKKILLLVFASVLVIGADAQIKKCAIISVFGNKNLSDDPLDTKLYEALLKDSTFDISGTVNEYETLIQKEFVPQFPFPFKDKSEIVNNEEYKSLDSLTYYKTYSLLTVGEEWAQWADQLVAADGYLKISSWGDTRVIKKAFEVFPDVDAVLIAYIDFNLYDAAGAMGISNKKVYAYANIRLYNSEAKRIFKLKDRSSSKKGVAAVGGFVFTPDKIKPLIFDAAEKLFVDMQAKMPKKLAKMAKKIDKMKGEDDN